MKDIAILMMIHKYTWQQEKLITHLAQDFDIYVHIDKRTDIKPSQVEACGKNVRAVKKYKVYWGHHSQFFTTLFILNEAYKAEYKRYVLISGEDIPLKSNAEISAFFHNNDNEYFNYDKLPYEYWTGGGFYKIDYFYTRSLYRESTSRVEQIIHFIIDAPFKCIRGVMKILHITRRMAIDYYGGSSWWNLTHHCVDQIYQYLAHNPKYLKKFKHTFCADEIFFQTIILNFVKDVHCENYNLRHIEWTVDCKASPHIFRIEDRAKLEADTKALFARKFDCTVDAEIIRLCYDRLGC